MLRYEQIDKKTYKIFVNRGFGHMDLLREDLKDQFSQEHWIKVRKGGGNWTVIDENMTKKKGNSNYDSTALGFNLWDEEVTNLDETSDGYTCFDISDELQYKGWTLTPRTFYLSSSIEELAEVLSHVRFCAWCLGDI